MSPPNHFRLLRLGNGIIETGQWKEPMNNRIRSGWTRFVMSLLHRNPEQVGGYVKSVSDFVAHVKPGYEIKYRPGLYEDDPGTFDGLWERVAPGVIDRTWPGWFRRQLTADGQELTSIVSSGG
jgi:hypothetical protein